MKRLGFVLGLVFGFLLAAARLTDYNTIHKMLLLQEPDVFLLMGSAVAVAAPILYILERRKWQTPLGGPLVLQRSDVKRNNVAGAILFGAGWAVAGTCPGPAAAMTFGGGILGSVVMLGLATGSWLRGIQDARQPSPAKSPEPSIPVLQAQPG